MTDSSNGSRSPSGSERALCPAEALYVSQRSRAVLSCVLRGNIDTEALSAAFDTITTAHPTLRSRITPGGPSGYVLRLLAEAERPRLLTRTGDLTDAYAAELNAPLPVGGPLTRAVLVSEPKGDDHLFVLVVDHTITDGHSSITLHNSLWDAYRNLLSGGGPSANSTGEDEDVAWPRPVSELLPYAEEADTAEYLEQRIEQTAAHQVSLVPYDVPRPTAEQPAPQGLIEAQRLTLSLEETARIRHAARRAGISVHGLVSAAVVRAARLRLAGDATPLRTLGCLSPVDLRSRLTPPLPASVMVAAVATHLQTVEVSPDTDPLTLARTLHTRLKDAIHNGDHVKELRITPAIPRHPTLQLSTVIVTNMGVVPGPRLPDDLRATDVRLVPARENYFPQAGRSPVMACVVSFEGRLAVEFPHFTSCFSASFMGAFRQDVREGLLAFAAGAEPVAAAAAAATAS
ncbi:condensation domain-containing protein [Streptomyces sp. NPDC006296]|uniref:phthiocerol/phthiodiolone dimycocerosyl transferase family protein n=1 Tax=Streptomyces sp. NPDC006296 TaxID=3156746 RepID=UPI0033B193D4